MCAVAEPTLARGVAGPQDGGMTEPGRAFAANRPPARRRGWRIVAWSAVAAAVLAGAVAFVRKEPSELPVYVRGAERMLRGAEIYSTADAKPFTYPPFFALPFLPFLGLSGTALRLLWYAVNLAVLAVVVRLLQRFYRADFAGEPRRRLGFWFVVAAVAGRHVLAILENQSHDMVVLAFTVAAALAWARRDDGRAGAFAGLGAACKATPALFALPFLLQRSWRALLLMAGVGAAATLLPDVVLPRADGRLWVEAWARTMLAGVRPGAAADLEGTWSAGSILNQSLSGTVYRLTTPLPGEPRSPFEVDVALVRLDEGARRVVVLAAQLAVVALVAWLARPGGCRRAPAAHARDLRLAQAAAVACGMVLLSPMSSKSHFGVLVLPVALAASLLGRRRLDLVLGGLLLFVFVIGTLTTKGIVGSRTGNVLLGYGAVTWAAVGALLMTARAARLLASPLPAAALASGSPSPTEPASAGAVRSEAR